MADKTIALNEEVLNKIPKGVFSDLIGAFGEQVGEAKLDEAGLQGALDVFPLRSLRRAGRRASSMIESFSRMIPLLLQL